MSRIRIVLFLLLVTFAALSPAQVSTAGLVGYWKMDGSGATVPDRSGLGNDGAIVGEAVLVPDSDFATALHIYGGSGAMFIPHHSSLEPATGTIEVWLRLDLLTNADIIAKFTARLLRSNIDGGFSVYGLRVSEKGYPYAFIAPDDRDVWKFAYANFGRQLALGEWFLLTMRWDGDSVSIFVDGIHMKSTKYDPIPGFGLSYYNGTALCVAVPSRWGGGIQDHFYGRIARLRVYDRPLSAEEIRAGYEAEAPASKRVPAWGAPQQ